MASRKPDDVTVIRRMLDAVAQGDADAFLAHLTDDVEWDDREGWPGVRKLYRGHRGVREWWDAFKRVGGEVVEVEIENLTPCTESRALLCVRGTFQSSADPSSEFSARAWYVFWLREGEVRRAQLFWDRAEAADAAGILERKETG
jgi:ketosteroid isomerase-like protein